MSFRKYWYVYCDSSHNDPIFKKNENCHQEYYTFWGQKDLVDFARKEGWMIGKEKQICPACRN